MACCSVLFIFFSFGPFGLLENAGKRKEEVFFPKNLFFIGFQMTVDFDTERVCFLSENLIISGLFGPRFGFRGGKEGFYLYGAKEFVST